MTEQDSPVSYNSGKAQALLDEDQQIQQLPLRFESVAVIDAEDIFQ